MWRMYIWLCCMLMLVFRGYGDVMSLFSPGDKPLRYLCPMIEQESQCVCVAAYRLTDPEVVNRLCAAASRGVHVYIITDAGMQHISRVTLDRLATYAHVYTFPPYDVQRRYNHVTKYTLMHNKFMLFRDTHTVWSGSCNFTQAARMRHQENIIIMRNYKQYNRYFEHFCTLMKYSSRWLKK